MDLAQRSNLNFSIELYSSESHLSYSQRLKGVSDHLFRFSFAWKQGVGTVTLGYKKFLKTIISREGKNPRTNPSHFIFSLQISLFLGMISSASRGGGWGGKGEGRRKSRQKVSH